MHPALESVFNEAESRYLNANELNIVGGYVESIPDRLEIYRILRDEEVNILQPVVDQLQQKFPASEAKRLERSTKNGILSLRTCAMGMLLNDQGYVQERIQWIKQTQKNNSLEDIDQVFYPLLEQQLNKTLGNLKMKLLQDIFQQVQSALLSDESSSSSSSVNSSSSPAAPDPVDELNLESLF
jgi:Phycobilisome protein